jgi:hypothetical protein
VGYVFFVWRPFGHRGMFCSSTNLSISRVAPGFFLCLYGNLLKIDLENWHRIVYFRFQIDKMATKKAKKVTKKITVPPSVKNERRYEIDNFGKLGKRVEIGANTKVTINKPGMKVEFFTPTIDVLIGIGKDHVANLIMDTDAWEALKSGEELSIDTLKEFKKNFL